MQFSILGILAVLLEFVRPFLPLLYLLILVELIFVFLAVRKGVFHGSSASSKWLIRSSVAIAAIAVLVAPMLTGATFLSLSGWLDYAALFAIGVGSFVASFVLLFAPMRLISSYLNKV